MYIFCYQVEVRILEGGCVAHHTIINIFLFCGGTELICQVWYCCA